jgi:hypothetical protein
MSGGAGAAGRAASAGAAGGGGGALGGASSGGGESGGAGSGGRPSAGEAGEGSGGAGAAGSGGSCQAGGTPATVLFLVDASLSMSEEVMAGNVTKWELVQGAFGQAFFELPSGASAGLVTFPNVPTREEPCLERTVLVPVGMLDQAHRTALFDALAATQPDGQTPTYDAFEFALEMLRATQVSGPKVIVFVTDGLPSHLPGCISEDDGTTPVDPTGLIEIVQAARDEEGITTLAVSAPATQEVHEMLSALGAAGGGVDCATAGAESCFFDLESSLDVGLWLHERLLAIANGACN